MLIEFFNEEIEDFFYRASIVAVYPEGRPDDADMAEHFNLLVETLGSLPARNEWRTYDRAFSTILDRKSRVFRTEGNKLLSKRR